MRIFFLAISILVSLIVKGQIQSNSQPYFITPYYYPTNKVDALPEEVVTNTNDSGPGSLRQAILNINANYPYTSKISFKISTPYPSIEIATPLPPILHKCFIDGYTYIDGFGKPISGYPQNEIELFAYGTAINSCGIELQDPYAVNYIRNFTGFKPMTYWVTNTNEYGPGSFTQAIKNVNAIVQQSKDGLDTIKFNIPGPAPQSVSYYGSQMPTGTNGVSFNSYTMIISPLYIDGASQPLNGGPIGQPKIKIESPTSAIVINSSDVTIKGISIQNCAPAIYMEGYFYNKNPSNIKIDSCVINNNNRGIVGRGGYSNNYSLSNITITNSFIGVSNDGKSAAPNQGTGIEILGSSISNIKIANNVISGNVSYGIDISSLNLAIEGNKIGTDKDGLYAIPNGTGINISRSGDVVIGGGSPLQGNIISGNKYCAILTKLYDNVPAFSKLLIKNNIIGADITGTIAIPNMYGICNNSLYRSGRCNIENNIVANHPTYGIEYAQQSIVKNNSIFNNLEGINTSILTGVYTEGAYTSCSITTRSSSGISGKSDPKNKVQLFYDNGYNGNGQGKDFIGEVMSDANGIWSYTGSIAYPCKVTALAYDSIKYVTSAFVKISGFDLLPDTTYFCIGSTGTLSSLVNFQNYTWSTGETTPTANVTAGGKYWVRGNNGCDYSDTTMVIFIDRPTPDLGKDTLICGSGPLVLDAGNYPKAKYFWNGSLGNSSRTYNAYSSSKYSVSVQIGACKGVDTIQVKFVQKPIVNLGKDTVICKTLPLTLNAKNNGANYLWSTLSTAQTIAVNSSGKYYVDVYYDKTCTKTDTIYIQAVDCDKLSGVVYEDKESNCIQESSNSGIKGYILQAVSKTNSTAYFTTTSTDGSYTFEIPYDNYDVSIIKMAYHDLVCPVSNNYSVKVAANQPNGNKNFGIHYQNYADISVGLQHVGTNRLGTSSTFQMPYKYQGASNVNAKVILIKDPFILVKGSNIPFIQKGDSLIWNLEQVSSGTSGVITLDIFVPWNFTLINKTLCSKAFASISLIDNLLSNNQDQNCFIVGYPVDPNAKLVSPIGTTESGFITSNDSTLEYTILFQNTGSDYAYDVVIKDTLSPYVDPATFEIIGSSFPCDFDLEGKGAITYTFKNIMLPDPTKSEKDSHGFVKYKVKQRKGLIDGTVIKSKADIYFDQAPGIATNYAMNTINQDLSPQTISFASIPDKNYDDSVVVLAGNSSSNLGISYGVSGPVKLVNDSLVFTGVGRVLVAAYQEGDSSNSSADPSYLYFNINKSNQKIVFDSIENKLATDLPFELFAAGGNSGNPILFTVLTNNATINGNILTITGSGKVEVRASQIGDTYYEDAISVIRTFDVQKAKQIIIFDSIPDKKFSDGFVELIANGGLSGNVINFKILSGNATIDGATLTFYEEGEIVVEATQAGNNIYEDAIPVYRSFKVTKVTAVLNGMDLNGISIYPNPVKDKLYIKVNAANGLEKSYQMEDAVGNVICKGELTNMALSIRDLNIKPGVYYLRINDQDQSITKKIVVE